MRECRRRTTLVRSAVIQRTHTDPVTRIVSGPSIPGVQTYPEARVLPVDQTLGTQGYFLACLVRDHHMVFDARDSKRAGGERPDRSEDSSAAMAGVRVSSSEPWGSLVGVYG